ncbi:hypothetical protein Tco_1229498 [Tanacetum coccineum]
MAAVEVPQTLEYKGCQLNAAPVTENTNHVKEYELASLFSKLKYEENLINSIYDTNKEKTLVSATSLSTAFFSSSIVQDFQDSLDDKEDTRSSQEYMNDLEKEYQARALLANSKSTKIEQSKRDISINKERYVKDLLRKYDKISSSVNTPIVPPKMLGPDLNGKAIKNHTLKGDTELHFIPTQYQLADIFIKLLDKPSFKSLFDELANAFENSKVSFSIPTGGIYGEVGVNTFRNAIGAHYLPHSSEYVAPPSIDVVRHSVPTIEYGEEVSTKGTLRKSLLPPWWRLLMAQII